MAYPTLCSSVSGQKHVLPRPALVYLDFPSRRRVTLGGQNPVAKKPLRKASERPPLPLLILFVSATLSAC